VKPNPAQLSGELPTTIRALAIFMTVVPVFSRVRGFGAPRGSGRRLGR